MLKNTIERVFFAKNSPVDNVIATIAVEISSVRAAVRFAAGRALSRMFSARKAMTSSTSRSASSSCSVKDYVPFRGLYQKRDAPWIHKAVCDGWSQTFGSFAYSLSQAPSQDDAALYHSFALE